MIRTLLIVFAVASFACCGSGGKGTDPSSVPDRSVRVSGLHISRNVADTIHFGRVRQGETLSCVVGLENRDTVPFSVIHVLSDCGCTTPQYDSKPVKPGETLPLTIGYNTAGQSGWQMKRVRVYTTLANEPYLLYLILRVEN